MSRPSAIALTWLVVSIGAAAIVPSQAQGQVTPGRIELGIGAGWASGFDAGSSTAELIRSQVPNGSSFPLFTTATEVRSTATLDARVAVNLTPVFAVEGHLSRGRPTLRTVVSGDLELPTGASAETRLTRYELDAGVLVHITRARFAGGRGLPYIGGGVGYLRELYERGVAVETGRVYHLAVGVKYRLLDRPTGWWKGVGVRGDARAQVRDGGVDVDGARRTHATFSVGLFVAL